MLVFQKEDYIRLARRHPHIYHNLMAIHTERLVRTGHTFLHDDHHRATFLVDEEAPPLLAMRWRAAWLGI